MIYSDPKCWEIPFLGGSIVFRQDSFLDWDAFIYFFHKAYSTSPAMMVAMPGKLAISSGLPRCRWRLPHWRRVLSPAHANQRACQ